MRYQLELRVFVDVEALDVEDALDKAHDVFDPGEQGPDVTITNTEVKDVRS